VLIHCSAGIDRTGAAIAHIFNTADRDDSRPTP
jgi:protein tyrosine/serine phosphatase